MAEIKRLTGAKLLADEKDAGVLSDGGSSDYELGKYGVSFAPVEVDEKLKNRDTIKLGSTQVVILHHPGHTKGSCSYLLDVKDEDKVYKVLIANLPTIITDRRFSEITAYPEIANDYATTYDAMENLSFDLWFASHASQFRLHTKYKIGDGYNPEAFADRKGYDKELGNLRKGYLKKIAEK
jgi:metallo-beta-lactamase class B